MFIRATTCHGHCGFSPYPESPSHRVGFFRYTQMYRLFIGKRFTVHITLNIELNMAIRHFSTKHLRRRIAKPRHTLVWCRLAFISTSHIPLLARDDAFLAAAQARLLYRPCLRRVAIGDLFSTYWSWFMIFIFSSQLPWIFT